MFSQKIICQEVLRGEHLTSSSTKTVQNTDFAHAFIIGYCTEGAHIFISNDKIYFQIHLIYNAFVPTKPRYDSF